MTDKLIIFDTTLRDGEQSPGAYMTKEEKLRIARQLEKLGVDVIEAGFAAASPGDADAIASIAKVIERSTVCSLARANEKDVRAAGEAIKSAMRGLKKRRQAPGESSMPRCVPTSSPVQIISTPISTRRRAAAR